MQGGAKTKGRSGRCHAPATWKFVVRDDRSCRCPSHDTCWLQCCSAADGRSLVVQSKHLAQSAKLLLLLRYSICDQVVVHAGGVGRHHALRRATSSHKLGFVGAGADNGSSCRGWALGRVLVGPGTSCPGLRKWPAWAALVQRRVAKRLQFFWAAFKGRVLTSSTLRQLPGDLARGVLFSPQ